MKVISVIMSFIMTIVWLVGSTVVKIFEPKDFSAQITKSDVEEVAEGFGYVNDLVVLFMDEDSNYFTAKKVAKELDGEVVGYNSLMHKVQVKVDKTDLDSLLEISKEIMQNEDVLVATPDVAMSAKTCSVDNNEEIEIADNGTVITGGIPTFGTVVPDDPWVNGKYETWDESNPNGSNWHLEAIQALSAWKYNEKFSHIDLGIVDSGFDTEHEDLQGKIVFPNKYYEKQSDASSHGTHVAGIISAEANNGIGVTGTCWDATLHCTDWEEEGKDWLDGERILTGLLATVYDGAKVVNFSCGLVLPDGWTQFPPILMDLMGSLVSVYVAVLLNLGYDFIVCQAAGNGDYDGFATDAKSNGFFCAVTEENCISDFVGVKKSEVIDRIIVVGNARNNGNATFEQSSSSNVGETVDICAPGSYIYSTDIESHNYYSYKSGTSMATPIVTAVCGMVWSVDKSFTGKEVANIVCDENNTIYEVEPTGYLHNDVDFQSYRMVNAKLAVENAIELSEAKNK